MPNFTAWEAGGLILQAKRVQDRALKVAGKPFGLQDVKCCFTLVMGILCAPVPLQLRYSFVCFKGHLSGPCWRMERLPG